MPLPYHLHEAEDSAELLRLEEVRQGTTSMHPIQPATGVAGVEAGTSGANLENGSSALASLRRRHNSNHAKPPAHESALSAFSSRFARIVHGAHAQDFERKRKSAAVTPEEGSEDEDEDELDDEDRVPDEEENDEELIEAERTAGQLGESVANASRLDQEQTIGVREMARRARREDDDE